MSHVAPDGVAVPCNLQTHGRCRICELIEKDSPHYREDYRRLYHPEEFGGEPLTSAPRGRPAVSLREAPTVAESLARIKAMKACPHWQASSDCGCGNNRCAAGKGRGGVVSHRDCLDCLGFGP